ALIESHLCSSQLSDAIIGECEAKVRALLQTGPLLVHRADLVKEPTNGRLGIRLIRYGRKRLDMSRCRRSGTVINCREVTPTNPEPHRPDCHDDQKQGESPFQCAHLYLFDLMVSTNNSRKATLDCGSIEGGKN